MTFSSETCYFHFTFSQGAQFGNKPTLTAKLSTQSGMALVN